MLAVTRARRQTHAHVNYKDPIDLIGLVRSPKISALYKKKKKKLSESILLEAKTNQVSV